jgi:S-DNA-T family DNA segregation ATPase FtsK/SpoIIIE
LPFCGRLKIITFGLLLKNDICLIKFKAEMSKEKEESGRKSSKSGKGSVKSKSFFTDERIKFVFGILITGFALYLLLACVAYLFWWKTDLSLSNSEVLSGPEVEVKNWSGKSGHFLAKMIITFGFGYGAFFIPIIFGAIGLYLLNFPKIRLLTLTAKFTFAAIILSLILSFIFGKLNGYLGSGPGGAQGYFITEWLNAFMGKIGTGVIVFFITISYLIFALRVKPQSFGIKLPSFLNFKKPDKNKGIVPEEGASEDFYSDPSADEQTIEDQSEINPVEFVVKNTNTRFEPGDNEDDFAEVLTSGSIIHDFDSDGKVISPIKVPINISRPDAGDTLSDQEVQKIMENYDPRLDLSRYKFPPVSILREHKSESAFDNTEVFENKENIIKTLGDHKISIKSISATVGPTVTLYEIVPERGVRLARIKSLEDDIALNLSALGIRIIAPIPGRGTVGIEVPNKKPEMVSMRSLITSKAFQETKFDIALALGRTLYC